MELKIDHKSPVPLHAQIEDLLRKMIELPEYRNGGFLPKEVELAKKLGISRNTLRQATNKLEYEGLLTRKKGVGTRVAEKTVTTRLDSWHSFTQEMNAQGVAFVNYEIKVEWVRIDKKIASFMDIPVDSKILRLARLRGDAECPFVYFESYFHPRVGLTGNEDFAEPLYQILEDKYSTVVSLSKERIQAQKASSAIAQKLRISKGDAVLIRERFVLDPGNRPVEYNIGFYRADKFTYSIDISI
ncbi:MAG: GntR family transcriptional regulator [Bacteroidota bacterium]|nr:GntR family transcriptional regulator [Bacteroidota bacterium]MDP4205474.1 GntR family transcriptional regulator [Bacteroidota bacterium]